MVAGNTESGIAVTYNDTNGKLNFDVNDPVITIDGAVTGSATMTNLGNVTITTVANHSHTATEITDFSEALLDTLAPALTGSGIVTVSYYDASNSIVITATEVDTLDSVTTRGASTTNNIIVGDLTAEVGVFNSNLTVHGNLTVNGTTTTVNSNEVNIGDAIILLNADEVGAPTQSAGLEVKRGTEANVSFLWDETADVWTLNDQTLAGVRIDGGSY
jgi:hypothetical protein